ncbi:MAG: 2-amino-4-hydroxy-6-hydroxymethyldihydropteridine diphosphokinase [Planctomycetota bacterium]
MAEYSAEPETRPTPPPPAVTAYIALGANLGRPAEQVRSAIQQLAALPGVGRLIASDLYETDPVGPQDQDRFVNAVVRIETSLAAAELHTQMQRIEADMGRPAEDQRPHWGPRLIDLDLLLFGDAVIDQPDLQVPHPRMHERWFVLKPLCDVGPEAIHPTLKHTAAQLLAELEPLETAHE